MSGAPPGDAVPERSRPVVGRVGLLVGCGLFLALLFTPGLPLDERQRGVAAVTALCATLWVSVAIPIAVTALLPVALFPLLGVMPAGEAAPRYMHDLVLLFVGAFVIALGLERWGVHERMALWIIARVGTGPRRLVLGFMCAAAFLSLWINNTATTLLMLPIAMAVIESVRREDGGEADAHAGFALCLLLGTAYCASAGGMGTLVGTAPNQVFLGIFETSFERAPKLSFGAWFVAWVPLVALFVPLAWLLMTRLLLPIGGSGAGGAAIRARRAALGGMTRGQKRMAAVFVVTALLWVTRADLDLGLFRMRGWSRVFLGPEAADPSWYALHAKDVSDSTVAIAMAALCFVLPAGQGDGRSLMNWATAARLPWEVLLLLGGGFCIAHGFVTSELDRVVGERLAPLLSEPSPWLVVGCVALVMSLLTELTSNTATTAVLLPVAAQAAVSAGLNPLVVMAPATLAASAAFMLPVATPPNAVVFGSRLVPPPAMARVGFFLNLLMVALITVVFQLWVRRVWGIEDVLPAWARD